MLAANSVNRTLPAPRCVIIAGLNGAGKTTFAREFLPREAKIVHFVNADLIAAGLSPLKPELAALSGGRLLLRELDRLATAKADFAFETTLSGLTYASRISEIVLDVPALRQYLATQCSALLAMPGFMNALPGMVFPDESLAERVQLLAQRLQQIAKLTA